MKGLTIAGVILIIVSFSTGVFFDGKQDACGKSSLERRQELWRTKYHGQGVMGPEADTSQQEATASTYDGMFSVGIEKVDGKFKIQGMQGAGNASAFPDLWPSLDEYGISKEDEQAWRAKAHWP